MPAAAVFLRDGGTVAVAVETDATDAVERLWYDEDGRKHEGDRGGKAVGRENSFFLRGAEGNLQGERGRCRGAMMRTCGCGPREAEC